ncbi:MAG: hypothetical protein SFX73_16995 [Kofleriaceae bacterium]|nr:hypothetical protein [Kofleriaceae bacterium]
MRQLVASVALFLFTTPAWADGETYPAPAAETPRRLGGHRFVPSTEVEWGFIDSWVSSTTLVGFTEIEGIPARSPLAAILEDQEAKEVVVGQSFGGSWALLPWLAATARVTAYGLIPRDTVSSIALGASELFRSEVGGTARLLRRDQWQLSARATLAWGETRSLLPARLPSTPYVKGDVGSIEPMLIGAYAPAPWVGLQATVSYAWRRLEVSETDDVHTLRGAAAASFTVPRLPVTALVGFSVAHDFQRDLSTPNATVLFGGAATRMRGEVEVFYQGRRDFDLGVGFAFAGDDDSIEERGTIFIQMGYYF